jgi:hypothetical protein
MQAGGEASLARGRAAEGVDAMLRKFLTERQDRIGELWLDSILAEYHPEAADFFKRTRDAFHNPVGSTLRTQTRAVVEGLASGSDAAALDSALESMIRIRSVQDMNPSKAVSIILKLKTVVRDEARTAGNLETISDELEELMDALLLRAFDLYAACREQVYSIRLNEVRNRSMKVMERLNSWREGRVHARKTES